VRDALAVALAVLVMLFLVLISGCSSVPRTVEVRVPVPVPCVEQRPQRPRVLTAAELKTMDDYRMTLGLAYDLAQLQLYALALEAALAGCE
jgi:hypothetical protein